MIVNYDEEDNAIGIEILGFSKKKINLNELAIKGPRILVGA